MQIEPFYLFLSWLSVESEDLQLHSSGRSDDVDLITVAMQHVDAHGRQSIITFIEKHLSSASNFTGLAQIFSNGHLYFKWETDDGPRKMLIQIRDAALSAPLPRSAVQQPNR